MSLIKTFSIVCMFISFIFSSDITIPYSAQALNNANNFTVDGINANITIQDLTTKHDAYIVYEESDTANGILYYRIDSTKNTDGVDVIFLNDEVYKIYVWYLPSTINEMGDYTVLFSKLVEKIGRYDEYNADDEEFNTTTQWNFYEINKTFIFNVIPERIIIKIIDTKINNKYIKIKAANTNVGF